MRQAKPDKRTEQMSMWCDECYVRIAPYEDFVTHKKRNLHRQCFEKSERRGVVRAVANPKLDTAMA